MSYEVKIVSTQHVKLNKDNPRFIRDEKFEKLVQSIRGFPEMTNLRPIVVDDNMIILGGNMRFRAMKEVGLKKVPIIIASGLSESQRREFIIKDNVGFGEWDWDTLSNEWDIEELTEWGLDIINFDANDDDEFEETDDTTISYKLELSFDTPEEQERAYHELKQKGYDCKITTV